jgi:hypothetical protein
MATLRDCFQARFVGFVLQLVRRCSRGLGFGFGHGVGYHAVTLIPGGKL